MSDLEQLMTKADVCAYLRCSERTLTEIPKAMLPWARIGSERLYSPSAIAAYVAARSGVKPEKPKKEARQCGGSTSRKAPRISTSDSGSRTDDPFSKALRRLESPRRGNGRRKSTTVTLPPTS